MQTETNSECCDNGTCECSPIDFISGENATPEQKANWARIREACKMVEDVLISLPEYKNRSFSDRCISLARTHLEECCQMGIKSVCFEGKTVR